MQTKKFNKIKPYSYLVTRLSDNKKYFGIRWSNVRFNRTPIEDFGKYYFTSHKTLKLKFKKQPKRYKFTLVNTFDSKEEAINHEVKFNKKIIYDDNWLNKAAFPVMVNEINPMQGRSHTDEIKKRISKLNTGRKFTKKARARMRKAQLGRKHPIEVIEKIRKSNQGKKLSKSTIKKISKSKKGTKLTKKHKKLLSKIFKGRKVSIETRKRMSKAQSGENNPMYGKKLTKEHRKKISEGGKGLKRSEETKKRMRKSFKGRIISKATRKKISQSKMGGIPWNKGKKLK